MTITVTQPLLSHDRCCHILWCTSWWG